MTVRVVLLGMLGSGKSYVARQAASLTGGIVLPFAKDVYRLAEGVLGRPVDKAREGDRALLKTIGTDWGREGRGDVDPELAAKLDVLWGKRSGYADIWVDSFAGYAGAAGADRSIFNDDTRFPNELCRVAELGFLPFYVACSEPTRAQRLRMRGEAIASDAYTHPSEIMNTTLSALALEQPLAPVLWNDAAEHAPALDWVLPGGIFFTWLQQGMHDRLHAFTQQAPPQQLCEWARAQPWRSSAT
ncbi:MAG: hypothetical protein R3C25_03520 [Hyphomonadaceae bacterium]